MIFQIEVKYTFSRNSKLKCPIAPFRTSSFEEISHFFNALKTWNQARQIRYLTRGVNKLSLEDNVAPLVFHANTGEMRKKNRPPPFFFTYVRTPLQHLPWEKSFFLSLSIFFLIPLSPRLTQRSKSFSPSNANSTGERWSLREF